MNASLAQRKYRASSNGWVLEDDEDTFDEFVPPPLRRVFVSFSHGPTSPLASVHQRKWERRAQAIERDATCVAASKEEGDQQQTTYPSSLIRWFSIGVVAFAVGVLLVLVSAAAGATVFGFAATVLLAFGATVVALTLVRGREIAEGNA